MSDNWQIGATIIVASGISLAAYATYYLYTNARAYSIIERNIESKTYNSSELNQQIDDSLQHGYITLVEAGALRHSISNSTSLHH